MHSITVFICKNRIDFHSSEKTIHIILNDRDMNSPVMKFPSKIPETEFRVILSRIALLRGSLKTSSPSECVTPSNQNGKQSVLSNVSCQKGY